MNQRLTSANLFEARRALAKLRPHLPEPRLSEWMTPRGIRMPSSEFLGEPNALPFRETPQTLLGGLGLYAVSALPKSWLLAHREHKKRWIRTTQLLQFHGTCLGVESGDGGIPEKLSQCDGVVAGLLLYLIRPRLPKLRSQLLSAALKHPFGAYLAAHGLLLKGEHGLILPSVMRDSRLAASLWRKDSKTASALVDPLFQCNDVWAAVTSLHHGDAEAWLRRVVTQANDEPTAAVTAITLLPRAEERQLWLAVLNKSKPDFAYLATRWTRFTWAPEYWARLRDQLRERALSDLGRSYYHWHRDIEPNVRDDALRRDEIQVLWAAELIEAADNFGQSLRRRCALRLAANSTDQEAKLTLRWLNLRAPAR